MKLSVDTAHELVSLIEKELRIHRWEDWYKIRASKVKKLVPKQTILRDFNHSLPKLLSHVYPQHPWLPWKFDQLPSNFWKDVNVQRQFMDHLGKDLGIKQREDWYKVSNADLRRLGGSGLEILYEHSLEKLFTSIYSESSWDPKQFKRESRTFLANEDIHKTLLEEIGVSLGIKSWEDWYHVSSSQIAAQDRGEALLSKYSYSIVKLLTSIYPNYPWELSKFDESQSARLVFDKLATKLGISSHEQWYGVTRSAVLHESGILHLIEAYDGSLITALMSVYPEYSWKPWLFGKVSNRFWKERKNQRVFFDWFAKEMGIKSIEDWYNVTIAQVEQHGGSGVIQAHGNALNAAIMNAHPEYEWEEWRFQKTSKNIWNNDNKARKALEWASKKLAIRNFDEWSSVTHASLSTLGLRSLVEKHGGVQKMMAYYYPDHKWKLPVRNSWEFQAPVGKSHQVLFEALHKLFNKKEEQKHDSIEIHTNYMHPELRFPSTGFLLEFDIYIPALSLAFEYQGSQHYSQSKFFPTDMKTTDQAKRDLCSEKEITLIEIPYWWNERLEDLTATIIKRRPDLIGLLRSLTPGMETVNPIPEDPPISINNLSKAQDWTIK